VQQFADLCVRLRADRPQLGSGEGFAIYDLAGEPVELCLVSVGGVEWAALSVRIGPCPPLSHDGLGCIIACGGGWALRLSLPVGEVSAATFLLTMERMAREARALRVPPPAAERVDAVAMWIC
jgi:hypothetical protein